MLAELMVLPAFRRQGIATRLRERLLERRPADLVVTTLDLDGDDAPTEAAGHVLRAWGWSRLGTLAPAPGPPRARCGSTGRPADHADRRLPIPTGRYRQPAPTAPAARVTGDVAGADGRRRRRRGRSNRPPLLHMHAPDGTLKVP